MFNFSLSDALMTLPGIVVGLTVHEYAHARMAYQLGDHTAYEEGRLTLNPLKHIDPVGFLMLMIVQFGWAKPVSFNPYAFKKPKRDEILVALAGPFSNLLMAFLFFGIIKVVAIATHGDFGTGMETALSVLVTAAYINLGLFVFNLLPIPPLDGSHLYMVFLRVKEGGLAMWLQRYGTLILLGIILFENNTGMDILPIYSVMRTVAGIMGTVLGLNI